jgi:Alpha/beta hydrolase
VAHSRTRRTLAGGATLAGLLFMGTGAAAWSSGADPHLALAGPPGARAWAALAAAVAPGVPAPDPASASPDQVRRFWAALAPPQRLELARRDPGVVGNLDGVPDGSRYAANDRARRADGPGGPRPAGRLLGYDPRGDGRVVEVFGDLVSARQVAVLVPGSGWRLGNLLGTAPRTGADPVAAAQALRAETARMDLAARVAVVVWLGYDAPEGIDREAFRSERAAAAVPALTRFLAGLPRGARVSLLCHSYGAVVCGRAAPAAQVADLVLLAAPGVDAPSAAALRTSARVWAARTAGDPIRFVPHVRVGGFGHGADPTAPGFGARVLDTGGARGHDGYYAPGTESLANLARIVLGRTSEVTVVDRPR